MVKEVGIEKELIEASEILRIVESYFLHDASVKDAVASRGLQVMLRESRLRVERAAGRLKSQEGAAPDPVNGPTRRQDARSLASRIQRLPEGEFRDVELDLESGVEDLVAEEY